jgi:hypothetical protein
MARKYQKYTPEFREEIATLVVEGQRANCSWLATSTYVVLSDQRPGAVGHHPAGLHTGQEHDDLAMPRTTATGAHRRRSETADKFVEGLLSSLPGRRL